MLRVKKFNKIVALALMLCLMAVSVAGLAPVKAKASTPEVQLYFAKVQWVVHQQAVDGYVSVNSGGSNKAVTVHYSLNNGTWADVSASYYTTDPSGYEVWHFQTPGASQIPGGLDWKFAVRYDVDGSTYWDNNGSNNYDVWAESGNPSSCSWALGKSALMQDYASYSGTVFTGSMILKNLAYNKTVGIRYTTDNWATYTDLGASYSYSITSSLERWYFTATIPEGLTVKYAIYYMVNGVTYWDNNFGANYVLN